MKILLFGFDGLRPDCINSKTMPRLNEFLENNVCFTNHRAVFPTETYVNHPCIFTGFLPERHGLVANAFIDPAVAKDDYFLGSVVEKIEKAENETRGKLFLVPSVTETLVKNGFSYISVSSNSPGSTRLMAHKVKDTGGVNVSVNGFKYAYPEDIRTKYGTDPESGSFEKPDLKGLKNINKIVKDIFDNQGIPDLSIIWYGEPDHSFHEYGIGAEESLKALEVADDCFGEIIDKYQKDDVQVMVMSDHGHITVKEHFDLTKAIEAQGLRHSYELNNPDADFSLLWGYSGNIYVHHTGLIPEIVKYLQQLPAIGMLFTDDRDGVNGIIDGTFSSRLVGGQSARAGDIRFIMRHFEEKDLFGFDGTCVCTAPLKLNCGIHGGLHNSEVNCLLGLGGNRFKKNVRIDNISGVMDVTPTIYDMLGIEPYIKPQGRVLAESFAETEIKKDAFVYKSFSCSSGAFRQSLELAYSETGIPYVIRGTAG